jgi:3-phenylpropionate/trans-cinnamate dioxygenase ferredoxin reductase subunit
VRGAQHPRSEAFAAVPFFWTRHYDTSVQFVGAAVGIDTVECVGDPRHGAGSVRFARAGRTLAVASIGAPEASLEAELALESGVAVARERGLGSARMR